MSTVIKQVIIPTNPADIKIIMDAVKEADASLIRIAAERDLIKNIVSDLDEKFPDIGKKYINKTIKTYHKQNFADLQNENEDFVELYDAIVK